VTYRPNSPKSTDPWRCTVCEWVEGSIETKGDQLRRERAERLVPRQDSPPADGPRAVPAPSTELVGAAVEGAPPLPRKHYAAVELGEPDSPPIAETAAQYIAPASAGLAASEARRRGNGTPPPMPAVQPTSLVDAGRSAILEREIASARATSARTAGLCVDAEREAAALRSELEARSRGLAQSESDLAAAQRQAAALMGEAEALRTRLTRIAALCDDAPGVTCACCDLCVAQREVIVAIEAIAKVGAEHD